MFRIDPDGVVRPDLVDLANAESLEPVTGGVTVTLERAWWSNGEPITATDVVRSVRRARPPSGFVGLRARALGPHRVRFEGEVSGDWARRLAVGTFVVPARGGLKVGSGPFVATRYVPGLEIVLEPNSKWLGDPPLLARITVQFVSSTQTMLELLERGRLDVAAVPSAVNIDDRLDEVGISYREAPGWETITLDLEEVFDAPLRERMVAAIDREHIADGLIRDDGAASTARAPAEPMPGPEVEIRLATASGDELLQLMQRIMQKHLARREIKAELVQVPPATLYGEWTGESPVQAILRREIVPSFDQRRPARDLRSFPLFSVHTFVAFADALRGVEVNGTIDGPLWNAHEWWLE